jgi:hypothetical protein
MGEGGSERTFFYEKGIEDNQLGTDFSYIRKSYQQLGE